MWFSIERLPPVIYIQAHAAGDLPRTLIPLAGLGAPWIVWGTRWARVQMSGRPRESPCIRDPPGRWRLGGFNTGR